MSTWVPIGHAGTVFRMSQLGHSPIPPDYNWIPTPLRFPPDYNHAFLQRMNITCPNRHWSHKENDFYFNQRGREMRFGMIWFPPFQFVNSSGNIACPMTFLSWNESFRKTSWIHNFQILSQGLHPPSPTIVAWLTLRLPIKHVSITTWEQCS